MAFGYTPPGSTSGNLMTEANNKALEKTKDNFSATNVKYFTKNTDSYYTVYVTSNGTYCYLDTDNNNTMVPITAPNDIINIKRAIDSSNDIYGPPSPRDVVSTDLQHKLGVTASLDVTASAKDYENYAKQQQEQAKQNTNKSNTNTSNSNTNNGGLSDAQLAGIIQNAVAQATDPMKQYIEYLESQQPRKIGADEAAELYDIDVNYDNILRDYNQATNDYYDNAISDLEKYRDQMQIDTNRYTQDSLRSYLNSYQNATPTASRKGAVAASALLGMLGNSADNAQADSSLTQNIVNNEKQRDAELANNAFIAKDYENNIRQYLSTLSTGLHAADVQKHVGELNAYATKYAAERAGLAGAALGTAYQYQGLANAAGTTAQARANNTIQKMKQFYNYYLGSGYADTATANAMRTQTTQSNR